jgi:hypothetical protein
MAPSHSGRELPYYNDALGAFLKFPAQDRQTYSDVLTQVYPLPADIRKLTDFCDKLLNRGSTDPGPWTFKPAAPWAVMQVCNYGKMAMQAQKFGWVSQHELAFGFPVAWYEKGENGQEKFKSWAMVYPYIYVDNPLSMSLGRQVYGWAKAGIELKTPRPNLQPNTRCLVSVELKGGPGGSGVDELTRPRFLEILQQQPMLSGRSGLASLYSLPARAMGVYLSAAYGMLGTFNSMIGGYEDRLSGYADSDKPIPGLIRESLNLTRQTRQLNDSLTGFLSIARNLNLAQERVLGMPVGSEGAKSIESILRSTAGEVRIITQKQFRDAPDPADACFSAMVGSTIEYSQPIDGAPILSDPLSPDSSGGIQINLRSVDIVENLGLEASGKVDDGPWSVCTLRPVMPFWVTLNARYGSADCQAWRTRQTNWSIDSYPDKQSGGSHGKVHRSNPKTGPATDLPYNPCGSDAFEEVPGPVRATNFGLWIYGLEAEPDKLKKLCKDYLKHQDEHGDSIYEFEVSPPLKKMLPDRKPGALYVLMIVSSFDAMSGRGGAPEFKDLSDRVLTFAIPATCTYSKDKKRKKPVLIPLYTFVEQDWDFLTEYEVYGRFAFKSLLESPPKRWVEESKEKRELLTVHTTVFPESEQQGKSEPQRARFRPLIQLWEAPKSEVRKAKYTDEQITNTHLNWLGVGTERSAQGNDVFIRNIGVKQVRDALETNRAGYQAIVGATRKIAKGWSRAAADHRSLEVRFYKYAGMTISTTMGIVAEDIKDPDQYYEYYKAITIPGARISGKMSDEKAQNLCWTIENNKWRDDSGAAVKFFS